VVLSLEDANRVMHAALAKARELNVRVSVAVCDAGGRLFAFQRMENSILASVFASQGKAFTAVIVGRPSGDVPDPKDNPALVGVAAAAGGILIAGKGGVPPFTRRDRCRCVRRRGRHLGSGRDVRPRWRRTLLRAAGSLTHQTRPREITGLI
jgi:glc operon protein GlcG